MEPEPYIYVPEALRLLDYSDFRSLKRWCRNHGVHLRIMRGSNKRYMCRSEFNAALLAPVTMQRESSCIGAGAPLTDFVTELAFAVMSEKPPYIPKNKRYKALKIMCNECDRLVYDFCKSNGKPLQQCDHPDKLRFKVVLHRKGTQNGRITRTLSTNDLDEAMQIATKLYIENKQGKLEPRSKRQHAAHAPGVNAQPVLFKTSVSKFLSFLNNEDVPAHRQRERSIEHRKDVEHALTLLTDSLQKVEDLDTFRTSDLTDRHAGLYYQTLLDRGYAASTFNRMLSHATSYLNWHNEHVGPVRNWFASINRRKSQSEPNAITQLEFDRLLEVIKPENGIKTYERGTRNVRNYFKPWLPLAFRMALYSGRRRLEILTARFADIQEDAHGNAVIKVEDIKSNRIQNRKEEAEKKYAYVPVTAELRSLLNEAGWPNRRGTDYIIAPDERMSRALMAQMMSRSFAHFYSLLGTGRELSYKSIRKAYITNLSLYLGGNAKSITRHSGDAVLETHYIDRRAVAKVAQGFSVFGNSNKRSDELDDFRNHQTPNQMTPTLEP